MAHYKLSSTGWPRSAAYRFTTTSLDDPSIASLKESIRLENRFIRLWNKYAGQDPTLRVKVRPRGPRNGNRHDTPIENATHFDVYVNKVY